MQQYIYGDIRIQFYDGIIRAERARAGKFSDENTFLIPDRASLGTREAHESQGTIAFDCYTLEVRGGLEGLTLKREGETVYTYERGKNSGELPPAWETPEVFAVFDAPRIFVPAGGYTYRGETENSGYLIEEDAEDVYLILARRDPLRLRELYVRLTGKCGLVPLSALGNWNSKYFRYTEESAKDLILGFRKYHIPLDNMVIDTDWRVNERGTGYEVNKELFPDLKRFLGFAHAQGVNVMFNDHPEPVEGAKDLLSPREVEYRESNLKRLLGTGLDIWWYDRNWCTGLKSPTPSLKAETWGMALYHGVTENYFAETEGEVHRRPVIMANADEITNGSYGGIRSSASHRYAVQWTGDIMSDMNSLGQEISNIVRCGDNSLPYVHPDCGGHHEDIDAELYVRWMQFGALCPVLRPHCANTVKRTRELWLYGPETMETVRGFILLRYRLLPVIYRYAYEAYERGTPIFGSLALRYPGDPAVRGISDQYLLGEDLLIAPVAGNAPVPLGKEDYVTPVRAAFFVGRTPCGEPAAETEFETLDMRLSHTSPLPGVPMYDFSAKFETTLQFKSPKELIICSDDGATVSIDGKKVHEDRELHSARNYSLGVISDGKPHRISIEYFQAEGDAACVLCSSLPQDSKERPVYLPAGRWLDVFGGRIYEGKATIKREYGIGEMPLFVRMGSVIPLAYAAKNTKEQLWDRLVFDFYPAADASDAGYLYEDDGETTAYRAGRFRKSAYEGGFSAKENAFFLRLHAAEGAFEGRRAFQNREISVKFHLIGADCPVRVTVNGAAVPFERAERAACFPLDTQKAAPDGDVAVLSFPATVSGDYEVKFFMK